MDRKKDAFDRTLAKHVRETMSGHKKVKKHKTHISRRIDMSGPHDLMTELETAETHREGRMAIHDTLNLGMNTLFPDVEVQIKALEIEDTKEGTEDTIRALTYKCNVRIMDMDIDDIEDLIYILDLLDKDNGAWYWNKTKDSLRDGIALRLRMMEDEENEDE
jgi:hypothetical protein